MREFVKEMWAVWGIAFCIGALVAICALCQGCKDPIADGLGCDADECTDLCIEYGEGDYGACRELYCSDLDCSFRASWETETCICLQI